MCVSQLSLWQEVEQTPKEVKSIHPPVSESLKESIVFNGKDKIERGFSIFIMGSDFSAVDVFVWH